MDAVGQRVAAQAHQQSQNNLRVAVPSFLREACPAQVVLTVGLEVQGGHVVENDPDMATKHLHRVTDAYLLRHVLVPAIQLVEIAVNLRQVHVLVKIVLQVLHRGGLAGGITQAAVHKLAEHLVVYGVEPHQVEHPVKYQLTAIEQNVLYARDHTLNLLTLEFFGGFGTPIKVQSGINSSTSLSSLAMPIVASLVYLPLFFSATITLTLPDRLCIFFMNIVKKSFAYPINRVCKITTI